MSNTYITTPESQHIAGYEYNPDKQILRVTFKRNNHKYDYYNVPIEIIKGLKESISKSAYFVKNIKNKFKTIRIQ